MKKVHNKSQIIPTQIGREESKKIEKEEMKNK